MTINGGVQPMCGETWDHWWYGSFLKWVYRKPQNGLFKIESPMKMDDLGVPYFRKPPYDLLLFCRIIPFDCGRYHIIRELYPKKTRLVKNNPNKPLCFTRFPWICPEALGSSPFQSLSRVSPRNHTGWWFHVGGPLDRWQSQLGESPVKSQLGEPYEIIAKGWWFPTI